MSAPEPTTGVPLKVKNQRMLLLLLPRMASEMKSKRSHYRDAEKPSKRTNRTTFPPRWMASLAVMKPKQSSRDAL